MVKPRTSYVFLLFAVLSFVSCKTGPQVEAILPAESGSMQEHSPDVFLVMYDPAIGDKPLRKAIGDYKCEIVYDYNIINGMALRKPADKTLEETMRHFSGVKGVLSVDYDHIMHLTDPVGPKIEIQ